MFSRYHDAVRYLEGLSNVPLEHDYMKSRSNPEVFLKRTRYFLDLIGGPDRGFEYVHVSGTAGKGSVATMTAGMLTAAGHTTGLVVSPAVTSTIERVRVDGVYIAPDEFADIVEYLKPFIDTAFVEGPFGRPSYFEIILAIALLYFHRKKCRFVVLEVGMGGRFDYTNVISEKRVAVITNIDYDHVEIIGPTLARIAFEKAGIISSGCRFITTERRPELIVIFSDECARVGADIQCVSAGKTYQESNRRLAAAIGAALMLPPHAIAEGLDHASLPCRFELIARAPAVVLDGAHNPVKIASVTSNLSALRYERLLAVLGFSDGKDCDGMLRQLMPRADRVWFSRFQTPDRKVLSPLVARAAAEKYRKNGAITEIMLDPFRALHKALGAAGPHDLVLVTGSFYLAGELRTRWYPEAFILKNRASI